MIYNEKEYDEDFKEFNVKPEILSDGDEIGENYGMDFVLLTDEHIKAIQEGKALCVYINCGTEYKDKDKCMKCESCHRKIDSVKPKYYAKEWKPMLHVTFEDGKTVEYKPIRR